MSHFRITETREKSGEHNYIVMRPIGVPSTEVRLFVHGAAGYASYLRDQMRYAALRGVLCVAPELPCHGHRALGQECRLSVNDYAAYVREFITAIVHPLYMPRVLTLVGHSMGGLIAQKVAESGLVDKLVLITSAPPKGIRYMPGRMFIPSLEDLMSLFRLLLFREQFTPSRKFIASLFVDPELSAPMIDAWVKGRVAGESLVALSELALSSIVVDPRLITIPTLVLGAGKDVVIHPDVAINIAKYLNAELIMLPDLGHMCVFEYGWENAAKCIDVWLTRTV